MNKEFKIKDIKKKKSFLASCFLLLASNTGFTLIELILYIALVSIFITGAVRFSLDIIYGREKAYQQQVVEQNTRSVLARISYEIRRAKNIQSVTSNQIVLDNGGSTTTINLSSGIVKITTGGAGPYNLSSNQVQVSSLSFTQLSSSDNNSKNIKVSITANQSQSGASIHYQASATMNESVELNAQFNSARKMLIDNSAAALSPNKKQITGLIIQNTGIANIVLDKMKVSWIGTTGGENLVGIQIAGGTVEWTGSQASGATADITNVTLSPSTPATMDYIEFSTGMSNATFNISWLLSDGSSTNSLISFAATTPTPTITPTLIPTSTPVPTVIPTITPSPTPTPTPVNCNQHCQQKYGIPGSCKKSNQCSSHNEGRIYECNSPNICCCQL